MVVQRGWYSSTDSGLRSCSTPSCTLHLKEMIDLAHQHGRKFGYVMTTGVEKLGPRLADAGVDVLHFVDPVQGRLPLEKARDLLGTRMTLVGGTNAMTLASGDSNTIRAEVRRAMDVLGPTQRFILHRWMRFSPTLLGRVLKRSLRPGAQCTPRLTMGK